MKRRSAVKAGAVDATKRSPLWFRHPLLALGGRWLPIAVCCSIAFSASLARATPSGGADSRVGYLMTVPTLVLLMSLGIARRRHRVLAIHDRQVDHIVGGMALVLAVGIIGLLVPRYPETFDLLRLDMYAAVMFVFGACVLVFGLRAAGRFWPVWLIVLLLGPLTYRSTIVLLGGDWRATAFVSVMFVGVCTGVAVARTWRRGLLGTTVAVLFGLLLMGVLDLMTAGTPSRFVQQLPAIIAAFSVGGYFIWYTIRHREPNAALVPRRRPTVERVWPAILVLLAATVALRAIGLPPSAAVRIDAGPPRTPGPGLAVPAGWTQTDVTTLGWAPRYFGAGSSLVRQTLTADRLNPEWDDKGRRRTVVVDTVRTYNSYTLQLYPGETLYSTYNGRRSNKLDVDLGHGVVGRLYTVVDENLFLTWTNLGFTWYRDDVVEAVHVIAVDNHEPDAAFPALSPRLGSIATQTLTIMLRGNAIVIDENPEYKDLGLLSTFGRELVARQWEAAR